MAKIWQISDGRSYVVNGDPGTTITYTNSPSNGTAAGKPVTSIPAGATSVTFPSNGSEVEISSDTATIDQVFNAAAAGSGSSSGGSGSSGGVTFQIVTTLPSQGAAGVIYLVKVSETGDDRYEEWIWVDSAWESIGTTAVDPTTYAKLIGGNTFEGNQVINGDLTVTGDVSGVVENSYYLTETTSTTITPRAGTWTRYTGSETALTIEEPAWTGEVDLAYLETSVPVTLTGVTWSPAEPILTGNGPFVYTLVHSREGEILAGAYGYSTPTAEAIQAVAPIAWGTYATPPSAAQSYSIAMGNSASASNSHAIALGSGSYSKGMSTAIGHSSIAQSYGVSIGDGTFGDKDTAITIGSSYSDTSGYFPCKTQGTGSITIGAGANTLNNGDTESSNSVTIGCKAENKGADSVVIGAQASASGAATVAIGAGCSSKLGAVMIGTGSADTSSVAIGKGVGSASHGIAIGYATISTKWSAFAIGYAANANGEYAMALGQSAASKANNAIAIGHNASVSNTTNADNTVTYSENTTVIGYGTTASAPTALTFGAAFSDTSGDYTCTTEGTGSITIGAGANTKNTTTTVDGVETTVESSNSVTIGCKASNTGADSVVIGAKASNTGSGAVLIGAKNEGNGSTVLVGNNINANSYNSVISMGVDNIIGGSLVVAIGREIQYNKQGSTCVGHYSSAARSSVAFGNRANAYAADYTVAVGSGATITNTGSTPSENTIVIGTNATASAPNAVVMGAGASATGENSIVMGVGARGSSAKTVLIGAGASHNGSLSVAVGAEATTSYGCVSVGHKAGTVHMSTAIGIESHAANSATSIGSSAKANGQNSIAIGASAKVSERGAVVIRSTAEGDIYTQLYFSGANTPLATEYEGGEAMMGYIVMQKQSGGNWETLAAGTQKLSVLFPNNSTFQPATIDEETGEWVMPKVFHPSDLDLPVEEPQEPEDVTINIPEQTIPEPEPYTPLPVYPIVEPEDATTNIPDPEPYTPLPVYPIVEPEVLEIVEEPTE